MRTRFASETSELAWKLFKETGSIGYYLLYSYIEHPPKEMLMNLDNEREI